MWIDPSGEQCDIYFLCASWKMSPLNVINVNNEFGFLYCRVGWGGF